VLSSMTAGHTPAEWCSREPGSGQVASTARIRLAPTTQVG
jgi:hypothetical protein